MMTTPTTPDTRPGNYYVSVVDGPRHGRLLGPFLTHQEALDRVDDVRTRVTGIDRKAHFYGFGTCRVPDEIAKPGLLNTLFGMVA